MYQQVSEFQLIGIPTQCHFKNIKFLLYENYPKSNMLHLLNHLNSKPPSRHNHPLYYVVKPLSFLSLLIIYKSLQTYRLTDQKNLPSFPAGYPSPLPRIMKWPLYDIHTIWVKTCHFYHYCYILKFHKHTYRNEEFFIVVC